MFKSTDSVTFPVLLFVDILRTGPRGSSVLGQDCIHTPQLMVLDSCSEEAKVRLLDRRPFRGFPRNVCAYRFRQVPTVNIQHGYHVCGNLSLVFLRQALTVWSRIDNCPSAGLAGMLWVPVGFLVCVVVCMLSSSLLSHIPSPTRISDLQVLHFIM